MPPGGSRILSIDPPVGDPVKRHRGRTGEDHAQENAGQIAPAKFHRPPRQHSRQEGKWKSEDRVAETDQLEEAADLREPGCDHCANRPLYRST